MSDTSGKMAPWSSLPGLQAAGCSEGFLSLNCCVESVGIQANLERMSVHVNMGTAVSRSNASHLWEWQNRPLV